MKQIILTLIATLILAPSSFANNSPLQQLQPEISAQLVDILNQLEPEVLASLLSEKGLAWYAEQFQRDLPKEERLSTLEVLQVIQHGQELGLNPVRDPRAPKAM